MDVVERLTTLASYDRLEEIAAAMFASLPSLETALDTIRAVVVPPEPVPVEEVASH
jgi:hypothetical protein